MTTIAELALAAAERLELTEEGLVEKVVHPAHGNMDARLTIRLAGLGVPETAIYTNTRLSPEPDGLRYVPDLMVILPANPQQPDPDADYPGAPDLVVEILSPATAARDQEEKVRRYARRGIPAYWIADPTSQTVRALRLDPDGRYAPTWTRPLAALRLPWADLGPDDGTG